MIIGWIDAFMVMMDMKEMCKIFKDRIGISILSQVNITEVAILKAMVKFLLFCIQNEILCFYINPQY